MSQKTAEPNEPAPAGSSESPGPPSGLRGWLVPGLIFAAFVAAGTLLRTPPGEIPPPPPSPTVEAAAPAPSTPAVDWSSGPGEDILLRVVDRRWEPWPATLTRGGVTRPVPVEGLRVRARPDARFGRLGGDRLAAREWRPDASDRWEPAADGSFIATVLLYPGKPIDVQLAGPGADVVFRVRCHDGRERGVVCAGRAPRWTCECRMSSRVSVYSDRWSVPWIVERRRFDDGPVPVPAAVDACFRFPEVPAAERTVVVIAPQDVPNESAMEATSTAVESGEPVCVRAPWNEPLVIGLGGAFSPHWSVRSAEPAPGTRTWITRPVEGATVDLTPEGGWVSWPVRVGPTE